MALQVYKNQVAGLAPQMAQLEGFVGSGMAASAHTTRGGLVIPGMVHEIVAGAEETISDVVTSWAQDILLPTTLVGHTAGKAIRQLSLVMALRGAIPAGWDAETLLAAHFDQLSIDVMQGVQVQDRIWARAMKFTEFRGGGVAVNIIPVQAAYDSTHFELSANNIPPGAAAPNQYFVRPSILVVFV